MMMKIGEVAELCEMSTSAIRDWANSGKLACIRTPKGTRLFDEDEVLQFLDSLRNGAFEEEA